MARTKADAGKKAGGKAPRKAPVLRPSPAPKSAGVSKKRKAGGSSGRNSACKRPVPDWQVPIGEFLTKAQMTKEAAVGAPPPDEENCEVIDLEPEGGEGPSTSANNSSTSAASPISSCPLVVSMLTPESQSEESVNAEEFREDDISQKSADGVGESSVESGKKEGEEDVENKIEREEDVEKKKEGEEDVEKKEEVANVAEEDKEAVVMEEFPKKNGIVNKEFLLEKEAKLFNTEEDLAGVTENITEIPETEQFVEDEEKIPSEEDTL